MMNTNRSSFKLWMIALTLVLPGAFALRTWGQKAPPITVGDKKITGVPEDWSFHHIVFPNPGPEENAIRNGTQKKWLGIVNDPRYVIQQLQRRSPVEGPAAAAVSSWLNHTDENAKKAPPSSSKSKTKIDKDWTMILGNGSAYASLIGTIGTVSSSTVSGSSTLTIDGQTFTASAPTSATSTGSFSAFPTSTTAPTITVNGGGQTITLTTNATAKTATGTITAGSPGAPLTGKTIVVPSNAGSIALTPGGSPATLTGSASTAVSSGTIQVAYNNGGGTANTLSLTPTTQTKGNVVGTFTASGGSTGQFTPGTTAGTYKVTSGSNTATLTPNGYQYYTISSTPCVTGSGFPCEGASTVTINGETYTFATTPSGTRSVATGGSADNAAQNLAAAVMGDSTMCATATCFTSSTQFAGVSASYDTTGHTYIFNSTGASFSISFNNNTFFGGGLADSGGTVANGTNSCSGSGSTIAGVFGAVATPSGGASSAAANMATALNACTNLGMTATSTALTVTATNNVGGATPAVSESESLGGFAAVATNGTGSAGGCTNSTTGTFGTFSGITAASQASNISAAISSCDSSFPAVGATSSYTSGTTFTVTAAAPGSAVTLTGSSSASGFTWSSSTLGNDTGAGTCTSGTAGTFVNSGVANTLAANIYNTLTNSSCTTTFPSGVTASHASNTNTFTVTANVLGGSPAFTDTGSTATIISWGSVTGGSAGTTACSGSGSGPWTATFMTGATTAATAANVTSAIMACSGASATITVSGSVTVSTAVPGTGSTLTVASNNMSIFAWGAVTAGTNGTDSSTTFAYWSGSAYDTPSQLATDLATAVADNATVTAVITAAANSPSSGNVTFTANTAGTGGNNYEVSAGSFSAFSPTSANLSGGGSGGLELNAYPAKYSFSTATPSCSDYVVYPTGLDGGTGQASVVAYNNVYVGGSPLTCSGITPSIYFAYNTPVDGNSSAAASLSPVLSLDGTQVAYVEVANGVASLVVLRMANSGGTISGPVGINYVTPGSYSGCAAPCYTTLTFDGNPNDTNSSPFVNYFGNSDLYVGDNSGKVHHFTGVFSGTPTESTSGWPVSVSSNTLTGVVYDPSNSFLYVGDSGGFLYSINTSNQAVVKSGQIATGTGIVDAPLIDSAPATPTVYVFVGDDNSARSGVYQFAASFAAGTKGVEENMGTSSGSTTTTIYDGAFDNLHYDISPGTGGSLYVCAGTAANPLVPSLYRIVMNSGFTGAVSTVGNGPASGSASCSPVTEFLGSKANTTLSAAITSTTATSVSVASGTGTATNDYIQVDSEIMKITGGAGTTTLTVTRGQLGTTAATHPINEAVQDIQDWAFLGVTANGFDTGCTGSPGVPGCLFNYSITTGPPTAAATGIVETGGTSGIIVDNLSTATGASQIYFNSLGAESCAGTSVTGSGTGGCAVQASQSAP